MFLLVLDRRAPWPAGALAAAKQAVYEGFVRAVTDARLPPEHGGISVDEQSGALILRDASARGFVTACAIKPVEESGTERSGDLLTDHLDRCDAAYWRVVVRYNPEGDAVANAAQASWVRRLCEALRRRGGPRLMCDLVLLPTQQQIALGIRAYDRDVLPVLTRRAISELRDAGVEPDVWIIEGFERRDAYARVMEVVGAGRSAASCLVRAAGHGSDSTRERMIAGLSVPGVGGVVLGPQRFWEPAAAWVCGGTSRAVAVATVASEFQSWISQLEFAL
jgi:myo-inositol catabolism protein IolC